MSVPTDISLDSVEARDAKQVDEAFALLNESQLLRAKHLALQVARRTPEAYSNQTPRPDGSTAIRFWDRPAFLHYCLWQKQRGPGASKVAWVGNAYPRAHFVLAFVAVALRQLPAAMQHLDDGERLEPENPRFNLERAQVHLHRGDLDRAFACLSLVDQIGPFVLAHDLAMSLRGRSFIHIQRGDLTQAEAACRRSLDYEPDNAVARRRLAYIAQLRRGGDPVGVELVATTEQPILCQACGEEMRSGDVNMEAGRIVAECRTCSEGPPPATPQVMN